MRLPFSAASAPTKMEFDVLVSQLVGLPCTGTSIRTQPTGGSEWQVVLLAEALAACGYRVGVINNVQAHTLEFGVRYIPAGEVIGRSGPFGDTRRTITVESEVVVSERFGEICPGIGFNRAVFDLHDLPDQRLTTVEGAVNAIAHSRVVVHSRFMHGLLPGWPRVEIIPCMIPDEFYELQQNKWQPPRKGPTYVYGSAAMKGLEPTLQLWRELKRRKVYHFKHAKLIVCSPGYDKVRPELLKELKDVQQAPPLTPAGMQMLLKEADGIFHVGIFPETFGLVFAQCEIAGKPAHVLRRGYEDALDEVLTHTETVFNDADFFVKSFDPHGAVDGKEPKETVNLLPSGQAASSAASATPKDYRVSTHIKKWLEVLGLKQPAQEAA